MPCAEGPDDDQLVARFCGGSDAAFDVVIARYSEPLTGYARSTLGGRHQDAEEVVQDVLVRAWAALRRHPERDISLRPWLYAIARNACLDRLRAPQRTVALEPYEHVLAAGGPGPCDRAIGREDLRLLVSELQRLPTRQRDAVVRVVLEGRAHADIAAGLGISVAASKMRLYNARIALAAGRTPERTAAVA